MSALPINMTKQFTSIAVCLAIFVLTGCAKPAPKVARYPEGVRTKLAVSVEKDIERMGDAARTLRGLAWVELDTASRDWQTEAAVVVARPDMLRVDVMDSLADVWAQIGSDGRDMWLYVPGKRKLYKGRASSRNMKRLASFDIEPADLISLFAGMPPLPAGAGLVQVGSEADRHLLDTASGIHLWLEEGKKRRVARCVRYSDDGISIDFEIAFSGYRRVGSLEYPHSIDASFPSSGTRLRVEYREVALGGDVEQGIFSPPARRGGKTVDLSRR